MRGKILMAATLCAAAFAPLAARTAATPGHKVARLALPGPGRGDYLTVDAAGGRLFVTHLSRVHVLDLATLRPIATVEGLSNAHGVVIDPASGRGFVTDGGRNTVVQFDPATGKVEGSIPVGTKPDAFLRDPASGMLLAFNGTSQDISVIDPAKAAVIATIKLTGTPEFAQADGKGMIWVNLSDTGLIAALDTRTMKLVAPIKLPGCEDNTPLAFDPAQRLLFAGCGNRVMKVVDADRGTVLASVPIGRDPDGVAFDPARKRIFVANRDGGWTIVAQRGRARYAVTETLRIDRYAKTIAIDPASHRVFSSTADFIWPARVKGEQPSPTPIDGTFRLLTVTQK